MELPFVFNNIQRCEEMTGGGKEAIALAAKVSQAWINFAKTGDPNHPGLPVWPKYKSTNTSTMHFDLKCTVQAQQDKELFDLLK
jgi:para-nitrobenzyl esterase